MVGRPLFGAWSISVKELVVDEINISVYAYYSLRYEEL